MFKVWKKKTNPSLVLVLKKIKVSSNHILILLCLLLLLLLLTMISYVVDAGTLEEIKLSFSPHPDKHIKTFHHTLNVPYEINLFDSEIDLIFEDGASKISLKNNALSLLCIHFIENIKRECAMLYPETKEQSLKVDKLFGDMTMSYLLKDGIKSDIIRVSDLARAILTNLNNPVSVCTNKNYADIYLCCSLAFPSRDSVIDGMNMDKLYRTAQSIPYPTTTTSKADHLQAMTAAFDNP